MNKKHVLCISVLLCLSILLLGSMIGTTRAKAAPLRDNTITQEEYDDYYGYEDYGTPSHSPIWIVIAIGIGLIVAAISGSAERSSMKTVRQETQARNYVNRDSLIMDNANEMFLYQRTERTPIQQQQPQMVGGMPMQAQQQQGIRQAYQQNQTIGGTSGYGGTHPNAPRGPMTSASVRPAYQPTQIGRVPSRSEVPNRTASQQAARQANSTAPGSTSVSKPATHNTGSNFSAASHPATKSMNQQTRSTPAIHSAPTRPSSSSISGSRPSSSVSRPSSSVSRPSSPSRPSSSVSRPSSPSRPSSVSRPSGPSRPSSPSRPSGSGRIGRPK